MWLDDDELDPDSEEGRAAMMHALLEAETGHVSPLPPALGTQAAVATGHSYHSGPPYLRCSVPWGLQLLREANHEHSALSAASLALEVLRERAELTVSVDWGSLTADQLPGSAQLVVRRAGVTIGVAEGHAAAPLSVTFSVLGAAAGEAFVADLRWARGSRNLHCLAPLLAPIRLDGLSAAPSPANEAPPSAKALTRPCNGGAPPLACLPDRGLGIELELVTLAPVPAATGCFTKGEELLALCRAVRARHAAEAAPRGYHALPALLARCALWRHEADRLLTRSSSWWRRSSLPALPVGGPVGSGRLSAQRGSHRATGRASSGAVTASEAGQRRRFATLSPQVDDHVMYSSADVAARTAHEGRAGASTTTPPTPTSDAEPPPPPQQQQQQPPPPQQQPQHQQPQQPPPPPPQQPQQQQQQLECLHAGGAGTMKSEFTSPLPAEGGALNFGRSGAAELACFVRLVRHLGAGAPALSGTANGGCSLHVHVNVRSAIGGGDTLDVAELLNVYFAWVSFDLVTARFARPWMWREPSMAPLYATGSEFAWHEKAWEQGHAKAANASTYDVPDFLRAVHALYQDEAFRGLPEAAKLERLFGRAPDTPASRIGRYCSLNLRKLTTYGTFEFRRFHGTLDPALAVCWAHFCVAFVECFRAHGLGARLLRALPFDEALAELAACQETATAPALMAAMTDFVDPGTAEYFMRASFGAQPM